MKPYGNMVTFEAMLVGYTDAVARFETVKNDRNPITAYVAVFEILNWAVALDQRIGEHWVPDGRPWGREWPRRLGLGAEVMGGVRFARNRTHHQWSDAMYPEGGLRDEFVAWTWRPADDLPKGRPDRAGDATYRELLEGRPVQACLDVLNGAFYTLQFMLEPHTVPHPDWLAEPVEYDEDAEGYYPLPAPGQ